MKKYYIKKINDIDYNYLNNHSIPFQKFSFRLKFWYLLKRKSINIKGTKNYYLSCHLKKIKKNKYSFNKYFDFKIKNNILYSKYYEKTKIPQFKHKLFVKNINHFLNKFNLEYLPDKNYERLYKNKIILISFYSIVFKNTNKIYNNKRYKRKYLEKKYEKHNKRVLKKYKT